MKEMHQYQMHVPRMKRGRYAIRFSTCNWPDLSYHQLQRCFTHILTCTITCNSVQKSLSRLQQEHANYAGIIQKVVSPRNHSRLLVRDKSLSTVLFGKLVDGRTHSSESGQLKHINFFYTIVLPYKCLGLPQVLDNPSLLELYQCALGGNLLKCGGQIVTNRGMNFQNFRKIPLLIFVRIKNNFSLMQIFNSVSFFLRQSTLQTEPSSDTPSTTQWKRTIHGP